MRRPHLSLLFLIGLAVACSRQEPSRPAQDSQPASELVFYNWEGDMPSSVLDAFTAKHGVKVRYVTFGSQEEAVETIEAGKLVWDVAVVETEYLSRLIRGRLLAEIDPQGLTNFKNVSPNFRDLAADPGNRHSVPYHFGTTGLLVRTDLLGDSVKRWADLWKPGFAGRIGVRDSRREVLGFTLVSLGYSFNSENPAELEAALKRLREFKKPPVFVEVEAAKAVPKLLGGEVAVLQGWAEDYAMAVEKNKAVRYVIPEEGCTLWGDHFVVSARTPNQSAAARFLDFLLEPEVGALMVNEKKYANANEAALPLVKPEIRNDPVIYPPAAQLAKGHYYSTLSEEGERLYADVWSRFKTTRR
ncbi:MAG: spermidine/putrescine ABC transporter substrate-binding protein [Deltaproteobacteria bacterium]|nr:spermidine/putrescine ABC transporter substrate-binding protein [Deltaproteobacteria bacterium]